MSFLSDLFGTTNEFKATPAHIQQAVSQGQVQDSVGQANASYNQTQGGLDQQQAFLNALGAQGGLQNQSSVFQQQQGLADTLGQQAQGHGPNPAMAQLNQQTGNNIAAQSAMMAGQRGSGANAGLLGRQAAMQGGNIQQQAVGQGATMQAQQQIAAQQALQSQQAQMAGLATNQVGQQANQMQAYNQNLQGRAQLAQGNQNAMLGSAANYNQANLANQANVNNVNSGVAQANQQANQQMVSGVAGGITGLVSGGASLLSGGAMAHGGQVSPKSYHVGHFAEGGQVWGQQSGVDQDKAKAAQRGIQEQTLAGNLKESWANLQNAFSSDKPKPMSDGGKVPGQPVMGGDDLKNDTVPAMLSPGEIVIPRSVMQAKDPAVAAAAFVRETLAKNGGQKKSQFDGFQVLSKDKQTTSLRHPKGHSIKIAHNALSKEGQDSLNGVPHYFAGSLVNDTPEEALDISKMDPALSSVGDMGVGQGEGSLSVQPLPEQPVQQPQPIGGAMGAIKQGMQDETQARIAANETGANNLGSSIAEARSFNKPILKAQEIRSKNIAAEIVSAGKAVQDGDIDPNKYIANMSTPAKISTAIGLLIGGFSAGLSGGQNQASKFLQDQIDNDILAQKANLGKKESYLSSNLKEFGNLQDAMQMTRANMLHLSKMEMDQQMLKAQDPIQKARLMQEMGKIDLEIEKIAIPLQQKQDMIQALHSGQATPEMAVNTMVSDPKDRDEARKELSNVAGYKQSVKSMNELFNGAAKIGTVGGNMPFSDTKANFARIRTEINQTLRKNLKGQGPISDQDAEEVIKPLLPTPGDTVSQTKIKLLGVKNILKGSVKGGTPYLDQYKIPVSMEPDLSPQEKQWAEFAKANPNEPGSQEMLQKLGLN